MLIQIHHARNRAWIGHRHDDVKLTEMIQDHSGHATLGSVQSSYVPPIKSKQTRHLQHNACLMMQEAREFIHTEYINTRSILDLHTPMQDTASSHDV
jgi:hypothetical protein